MNAQAPVLALEGVSKSFGPVRALDDVDLELNAGEVVALVGDNGAGKSTLVKAIAGINPPDEGQVLFEGSPVTINNPTAGKVLDSFREQIGKTTPRGVTTYQEGEAHTAFVSGNAAFIPPTSSVSPRSSRR